MANRHEVRTLSLDKTNYTQQWSALSNLAADLELGGNVSGLARWLADIYTAAPAETVKLLQAARDRAAGGGAWNTLAMLRELLPPMALSAAGDE